MFNVGFSVENKIKQTKKSKQNSKQTVESNLEKKNFKRSRVIVLRQVSIIQFGVTKGS